MGSQKNVPDKSVVICLQPSPLQGLFQRGSIGYSPFLKRAYNKILTWAFLHQVELLNPTSVEAVLPLV